LIQKFVRSDSILARNRLAAAPRRVLQHYLP
jgi:hypothetical protein